MKASPYYSALNAGEWSPQLEGRVDLEKYPHAMQECTNNIPMVYGGVAKRPGTRFVTEVKDSSKDTRLLRFEFNTEQAYILEFGDYYMRVFKDGGAVLEDAITISAIAVSVAPAQVTTLTTNVYQTGDSIYIDAGDMVELTTGYYPITRVDGTHFTLDGVDTTGNTAYTTGGTSSRLYEIETPYTSTELSDLRYIQSADTDFITHPDHPPFKLQRFSHTDWHFVATHQRLEPKLGILSITKANPAVVGITGHAIPDGTEIYIEGVKGMTEVNWGWYITAGATANTFQLVGVNSSTYGTYEYSGSAYVVNEHFWQPLKPGNIDENITLLASGVTGSVTITAATTSSAGVFTAEDVGKIISLGSDPRSSGNKVWTAGETISSGGAYRRYESNNYKLSGGTGVVATSPPVHERGIVSDGTLNWEYKHSGYGLIIITAYTDSTHVTATVWNELPGIVAAGTGVWDWAWGAWDSVGGFPTVARFYEDRLYWSGVASQPQTFWGSRVGDYEQHRTDGTEDDSSVNFTISSDQVNAVQWMSSSNELVLGTRGGTFIAHGSGENAPITPSSILVKLKSTASSKNIDPVTLGRIVLFGDRTGRRLYELIYDLQTDTYDSPDLTMFAEHITAGGIEELSNYLGRNRIIWARRADGILAGMTYEREQEVIAWHKQTISGVTATTDHAVIKSVATIPGATSDQTWMIAKRTINSVTRQYIEYFEAERLGGEAIEDSFFVDCGLTYSGAAATEISGLDHLEGETVTILADGATHDDKVVASGSVTLDEAATKVQIGLGFVARGQTMRVEAGGGDGTSQAKTKRVTNATFRIWETGEGLEVGPSFTDMVSVPLRKVSDPMDAPVPLFTGDSQLTRWPGGYEEEGRIAWRHSKPLPCVIIGIAPQLKTQDR